MQERDINDVLELREVLAVTTSVSDMIRRILDWRDGQTPVAQQDHSAAEDAVARADKAATALAARPAKAAPTKATKGRAKPPPPVDDDDSKEPSPDPSDDDADF
jgi:hypothetical protein